MYLTEFSDSGFSKDTDSSEDCLYETFKKKDPDAVIWDPVSGYGVVILISKVISQSNL